MYSLTVVVGGSAQHKLSEFIRHYESAWVKAHWTEETAQTLKSRFKFNSHGRYRYSYAAEQHMCASDLGWCIYLHII